MIVIISVLLSLLGMGLLYYTPFPWLLIPVALVPNYILFRRLLVTRKIKTIAAKSFRPLLWYFVASFFFYSVHVINLIQPVVFLLCMIALSVVYGLFCYVETQAERNFILDNVLTVGLVLMSMSLGSLLMAFWHWPIVLVLAYVWAVQFLIALWWLLDFTNNPQILAALWAFVAIEFSWLSSRWVVLYQIPHIPFIISLLACVVTALAYGWGGIYYHYKKQNLKPAIVFEYLAVTTIVFVALLVLNRWIATG